MRTDMHDIPPVKTDHDWTEREIDDAFGMLWIPLAMSLVVVVAVLISIFA